MAKYCPICNCNTNCTENNCDSCKVREGKRGELLDRIHAEQKNYLNRITRLKPHEIIAKAYEINWRNEFVIQLENTVFDDETLEVLLDTPYLLDALYEEWLGIDDGIGDMVADAIHYFAKKGE